MTKRAAARVGDPHTCAKIDQVPTPTPKSVGCWPFTNKTVTETVPVPVQHQGQPIAPTGSPDVKIEKQPAARCGDRVGCIGAPPVDVIVSGAAHVKINGRLAAMVDSACAHPGKIVGGAAHVVIGDELEGATFGDDKAATEACRAAALTRKQNMKALYEWEHLVDYQKYRDKHPGATVEDFCKATGKSPPPSPKSQSQSYQNSCGHETARQLCIQKCRQGHQPACKACSMSEEEWYSRYLKEKLAAHNKENADAREAIKKENQKKWEEVLAWHKDHDESDIHWRKTNDMGQSSVVHDKPENRKWDDFTGQTVWLGEYPKGKQVKFEPLPQDKTASFDESDNLNGDPHIGSHDATRRQMLKDWCGIDTGKGSNVPEDIAAEVAAGKTVVATVDIGRLKNGQASGERHVITVTKMKYNADGTLDYVITNDTARDDGCGKRYSGKDFGESILEKQDDGTPMPTITVP